MSIPKCERCNSEVLWNVCCKGVDEIFPSGKWACCSEHETYGPTTPGAISYIRVHPLPGRNDFIMCCAWSLVQNQNCMNRLDWSKYLCHVFKYLCPLPCQNLPTFLFKVIKETLIKLIENCREAKQHISIGIAWHTICKYTLNWIICIRISFISPPDSVFNNPFRLCENNFSLTIRKGNLHLI